MIYKVIGLMSGSSLDGLDIAYVHLEEIAGVWNFAIINTICKLYEPKIKRSLEDAINLSALDYNLLHSDYGHYLGTEINDFIKENKLEHQVDFIASHGHTTFHIPQRMTHQLGNGAAIAAEAGLPVICDLRALDVAMGGQGAPIVPIGDKWLFKDYNYFLNLGGIANVSIIDTEQISAFDVCPANRVLNMLAGEKGMEYDKEGALSSSGKVNEELLDRLNELEYYALDVPKSLSNSFGTDVVYPLIKSFGLPVEDALRTYTEHIAFQIAKAFDAIKTNTNNKVFTTGGGAFNTFLISKLNEHLERLHLQIFVPSPEIVQYKEALVIAFMGALRWREEFNVLKAVTGAKQDSISGALWLV